MTDANTERTETDDLLNVPTEITIGEETVELTPMRFGQTARLARIFGPVLGELVNTKNAIAIVQMFSTHSERFIEAMALMTGKGVEWVEELENDDAIRLMEALYLVNRVFFIQRIWPVLSESIMRVAANLEWIGASLETTTPAATGESGLESQPN